MRSRDFRQCREYATITLGMVSLSVKLYSVHNGFGSYKTHYVHAGCGERVRTYACCDAGHHVAPGEKALGLVTGYVSTMAGLVKEVVAELDPSEVKEAKDTDRTKAIQVSHFIDESHHVLSRMAGTSYWLMPDRHAEVAYATMAQAMHRSGRYAVVDYTSRGDKSRYIISSDGTWLCMHRLKDEDGMQRPKEAPPTTTDDSAVDMMCMLIDEHTDTPEWRKPRSSLERYFDHVLSKDAT